MPAPNLQRQKEPINQSAQDTLATERYRAWASGCHHETVGLGHLSLGDRGWWMRQRKLCSRIHHLRSKARACSLRCADTIPLMISAASPTSMPPSCISLGDHIDDAVLLCGVRLESEFSSASLVLSRRQPSRIHGTALQDHRQRHREGGHARKPLSALCTRQQAQVHLASYQSADEHAGRRPTCPSLSQPPESQRMPSARQRGSGRPSSPRAPLVCKTSILFPTLSALTGGRELDTMRRIRKHNGTVHS